MNDTCEVCGKPADPGTAICNACIEGTRERLRRLIARNEQAIKRPPVLTLKYGKRYVYRGLPQPTAPLVPNYRDGDKVYGFKDPNTGTSFGPNGNHHIHGFESQFDLVREYRLTAQEAAEKRERDFWTRFSGLREPVVVEDDNEVWDPEPEVPEPPVSKPPRQRAVKDKKDKTNPEPVPQVEPTPLNPLLAPVDMGIPPLKGKYKAKKPRKPKPEPAPSLPVDVQPEPEVIPAVKICDTCHKRGAGTGERLCTVCKKKVLAEIKSRAWFDEGPSHRYRSQEQKENTYETKYGIDDFAKPYMEGD